MSPAELFRSVAVVRSETTRFLTSLRLQLRPLQIRDRGTTAPTLFKDCKNVMVGGNLCWEAPPVLRVPLGVSESLVKQLEDVQRQIWILRKNHAVSSWTV